MCVVAGPLALGLGSAAPLFYAGLGLSAVNAISQRNAAKAAAAQTYQSSLIANRSAEQAFAAQQEALAAQLKESRASKAQDKQAATIRSLQAKGAIQASGRSGLTIDLLLQDQERQSANFRESINQALESASRQYARNVDGLTAQRDDRRNQLISNINQAYNQIPSLGSALLNVASQGLSTYGQLYATL
tara:strand:+ start:61 stop:627 length:567 start_codon:yes stop_codon:yes gene_type:complete